MDEIIDPEAIENLGELFRKVGEAIAEILERVKEAIEILQEEAKPNNTKYKLVKSLIRPYKQPFIKVRHRARANL